MKHLIRWSGFAVAGAINGYLVVDSVVLADGVDAGPKVGFTVMLALLVGFIVGWAKVNKIIGRKLQAVQTAKEMNVVGSSALWWTTALEWSGVVIPLGILGGLFYFVGTYFGDIGQAIGLMTATLTIPMATSLIYKVMQRNDIIESEQLKQENLIKGVADEVIKVRYR